MSETTISSFVVRFVQESAAQASWRGIVRHVQSNQELRFTRIQDAVRFMAAYIDLNGESEQDGDESWPVVKLPSS